jgi:hypothetical protein
MCKKMFLLIVLILVLAGCISAPAETRAGKWSANTEYGDFAIYVSDDGMAITQVDYDFECKGMDAYSNNQPWREPFEGIDEGGKLSMFVRAGFIRALNIEAKFSANGKRLSGTVTFVPEEVSGGCKANFSSTR